MELIGISRKKEEGVKRNVSFEEINRIGDGRGAALHDGAPDRDGGRRWAGAEGGLYNRNQGRTHRRRK